MEWSQKAFGPEGKTQLDNIMSMMESLKCGEIASDEKELRQKFAGNATILRALDTKWVKVVKRLPVRIAVPPDSDQPR
jgi:multidrug resistance efflux pump